MSNIKILWAMSLVSFIYISQLHYLGLNGQLFLATITFISGMAGFTIQKEVQHDKNR